MRLFEVIGGGWDLIVFVEGLSHYAIVNVTVVGYRDLPGLFGGSPWPPELRAPGQLTIYITQQFGILSDTLWRQCTWCSIFGKTC